ncbi:MFS general substrate transporter [Lojkania enalia]|uniref:MFS general substrate transporter n=1 Tax=Lojkania enalia TaxID=147567 RepID=A0A9P4MXH7_9PLEO|nr:MFS general substrate transporter [Didymosphaeria enalia]
MEPSMVETAADITIEHRQHHSTESSPRAQSEIVRNHPVSSHEPVQNLKSNLSSLGSQYTSFQWFLIALSVYSSAFFYGLDTTIVAVIQGPVVERFGDVEKLGWLGIGFPLGSIATIAAWSKTYGLFDTKWMYIGSLVNFAAGSTLCGAAADMNGLINVNIQKQSLYISGGGIVWGVGCILGPIIGGAFADSSATWRWAFYINLILFAAFTPVYFFVLHSYMPRPNESLVKRVRELDWLGVLLNAGMYTCFVIGFAIGGTLWPWNNGRTIATIVACGALLLLFILQQKLCVLTLPERRIFPTRFLSSRTFLLLYLSQCCIQAALAIPIYYIPLFFQFTRSETAVTSAVRLLPFIIVNIVTVFLNGALLPKFRYYSPWYLASGIFNTVGGALFFATLNPYTSTGAIYGYSILLALGTGLAQQAAYSVASVKAPNYVSDAIGFINSAQVGSVVVALTLTSLIFQNVGFNRVKNALTGLDLDDEVIRAALGGAKSSLFEEGTLNDGVRTMVEAGIVEAIRWSFFPVLLAGAIGLLAGLLMKWERLFDTIDDGKTKVKEKN